ncbi:major facilitator superfamily domain-containing protein [Aspergillus pseudoustus]|uniref:Major facilitator superfamily domain-containing protein n=1 Tax=Aspergillus pseudoustus TaxID=1810923 RepID=A0ABR4K642_9EURO
MNPRSGNGATTANPSQVLCKVDRRLIPLLFTTYMLSFMDKTILSSAAVFGLIEDTHLHGQQYSWVSSMFYIGYLVWEWPTSFLIPRLPVARYLAANTIFWGVVVALTSVCVNYGGLLTVRFFLGVAEATITPAFMFITSTWYTRDEIPVRTAIWFAGNSIGGLVASLLAYGIGHIEHPLRPWMWMFIILGITTFLWAFVLLTYLPNSISTASFLTDDEKEMVSRRVITAGTGRTEGTTWNRDQAVECFRDPKTWHLLAIACLTQIPNGGIQNFANLVIESFGFTALESTLVNIPFSIISGATVTYTGWLAGQSRRLNCILIALILVSAGTGSALIHARIYHISQDLQLLGFFLLAVGPGALPLTMSLAQANYKGVTKKMTMTGSMFVAYCVGNIAGPHLFRASEAPAYETSFRIILICYALAASLALSLRAYLCVTNARRDHEEGHAATEQVAPTEGGSTETSPLMGRPAEQAKWDQDLTDWDTVGFRYRY